MFPIAAGRFRGTVARMCRNITTLRGLEPEATAEEIEALQGEANKIAGQRESIFKGEMLRGTLLNTYAWWTIGRIAFIAAISAFVAAADSTGSGCR